MNISSIAQSGISAGLLRQQVAAGNVAHAPVQGYVPQRVALAARPGGGVQASIESSGLDGVQLSEEIIELAQASHDVSINAAVVGRASDTTGSLLDILA